MSGPGLNQRDAHHAIHQAAFAEAEQLTLLLRRMLRCGDQQQALQVAAALIEHWQTRTLHHAEAEETGWYREILAERPERQPDVIALTRDHELLRKLLAEIQGILFARGIAAGVVERFEAMLLLNGIHSHEEERRLFGGEAPSERPGDGHDAHDAHDAHDTHDAPQPAEPSGVASIPLAIARPALHARLSELLRQRGLSPTDLQAHLHADPAGQVVLRTAFGRDYAQALEWPLEADAASAAGDNTDATEAATEATLRQVVEACERATQADYHTRMRTPT